uniref:Uncharacterized protein LOC105641111 isoform X1 n=1 Tax=Rhizophora mucronata TaxID=61149 RepID=A0A2P2PHY6_RHIMU
MELSFSLMPVDMGTGISLSNEKQSPEHSKSAHRGNKPVEIQVNTSTFVNHGAIAWHENRRKWIGDQSRQTQRVEKDPIISWSTTYEELLSNHEPFPESIPLPEMVDFLVDIWHDEGLFD